MTRAEFIAAVGHEPVLDDLERANCSEAGKFGHLGCGVCEHGRPVFLCFERCWVKAATKPVTKPVDEANDERRRSD